MHVSKSDGDNWEKKWQIVNWAEIVILWLRWKTVVALAPLFSKYLLGALAAYKSCRVNVSHRHTIAYLHVEREMKKNQLWCFQQCTGEYLEAAPKRWCFVSIAGIFFKFSFKKTPTQFLWMRGFLRKKKILSHRKCSETKATHIEPEICEYLTFTSLQDFVSGRCVCVSVSVSFLCYVA